MEGRAAVGMLKTCRGEEMLEQLQTRQPLQLCWHSASPAQLRPSQSQVQKMHFATHNMAQ